VRGNTGRAVLVAALVLLMGLLIAGAEFRVSQWAFFDQPQGEVSRLALEPMPEGPIFELLTGDPGFGQMVQRVPRPLPRPRPQHCDLAATS
jgi:hypothetical protein